MPSPSNAILVSAVVLGTSLFASSFASAQSVADGERTFSQKCTACHTIGRGKLVGPDLQGVTTRREDAWLRRQIKEPQALIAEGDPIATQLVKDSGGVQMIPLGLADAEVDSLVAYLQSTGEQQQAQAGVPSQYVPSLLLGIVIALGLTGLALSAGKKNVDVR